MSPSRPQTILFITGAFITNGCWDQWKVYFETKGYKTFAPSWPHKDATAEVLRNRQPDALVASNRLADLVDYYAGIIKQLPHQPILIGHSIGGLIVQLLLQRGLGALGAAIHPVPPQGIFTLKLSFLKAGWGALGFFTPVKQSYLISYKAWQYGFTNGMDDEEQKEYYYRYAIPESKLIVRDTITKAAKINFKTVRPPLLIISGSTDHSIPASLNYSNFRKYRNNPSVTDYKEFAGHNHFVFGRSTWKENAEYVLEWIGRQAVTMG